MAALRALPRGDEKTEPTEGREGHMATGDNIRAWFDGCWRDGDVMIMRAADHGSWLGTTVFELSKWRP